MILATFDLQVTLMCPTRRREQEAHGPRFAHLSDTATADMQMQHLSNPIIATNENIII